MTLSSSITTPQRWINPYRGLVVDVPTWTDAHEYHRVQQRLHGLSMHIPGVVSGLDVIADEPPGAAVTVYPGVARGTPRSW